jgi:hypothetical protein
MSTSALVDLEIDQGADYGVQLYWTSMDQQPFTVLSPMRMEIRDDVGNTMYTLATSDGTSTGAQTILYNSSSGLIQLMIPAADTSNFPSGVYQYDLFVTYQDNDVTNATRLQRLIRGNVYVNKRVTQNV